MKSTIQENHKFKALLTILIPVLIYQIANYSAQFIDTVMTGRYNEVHLAGVSIGGSLYAPFFTLLTGLISDLFRLLDNILVRKNWIKSNK